MAVGGACRGAMGAAATCPSAATGAASASSRGRASVAARSHSGGEKGSWTSRGRGAGHYCGVQQVRSSEKLVCHSGARFLGRGGRDETRRCGSGTRRLRGDEMDCAMPHLMDTVPFRGVCQAPSRGRDPRDLTVPMAFCGFGKSKLPEVVQPTSSRRVFTSLQSCTPFNGRLKSQIAGQTGNYEKLVVRAGSERGVRSADGGQTLDIPLLGEFQLPNFRSIRQNLSEVTPLQAAKWTTIVAVAYAAMSTVAGLTVFNANFWMYASWLGVVWPWPAAIVVGIWTLLGAIRQAKSGTKEEEQVFILGGALVWLILVPLAHVHGFVDGWPLLLYTLYYFFFSISAFVRDRMYGSLSTVPEEKRWQSSPPQVIQNAFITAIVGGHWAAAFESPFLVESWNWAWQSKLAAGLIALAVVAQWNAVYFLGKYSDRLVNPTSVVIFGPYRWVRHPMYASYILLCAGYCLALRSYFSLLFLLISCIAYYDQRTKLEEKNLVEAFGATYISYREKTKHKYLPWLY